LLDGSQRAGDDQDEEREGVAHDVDERLVDREGDGLFKQCQN
jgi:hypothetical protein